MADVSSFDLGSSSNPLPGLDPSDYAGYGAGGNQSSLFGDLSTGGAGALGLGALGFGALLAEGPGKLPPQFGALQARVPVLQSGANQTYNQGEQFVGQGQKTLEMAATGELTAPQKAELAQYQTGLQNLARQQFYSMGLNPDQNTAFITQQANIDAQVNAMAQKQIQSTIALGLGQISAGTSLVGQSLGFENAANQALLQAGEAQLKQDQNYSNNLVSAFGSIGKLFGSVAPFLLA